jgi:serine/threonine protein kinase/Tol biopolymer transport system component
MVGPYEVQSFLAAGGMGEVYRAVDTRLGRTVAIKFLPPRLARDPERRERFSREAAIVSQLNHPHICALYDLGVDQGIPYLVMEFVDGETLQVRLERGAIPWRQALDLLVQITDALDKAHRRGVVHRDLKPANLMLTKSGAKLLDFGLAAWSGPELAVAVEPSRDERARLTVEGRIIGTVQYLSPEQLHGKIPDARTDIFAFGLLAYEMLSGRRAFDGDGNAGIIAAILKDDPPPLHALVPGVPRTLAATIMRCLAREPDERWQTANDLRFQLSSIVTSSPETESAPPSRALSRRAERWLWSGITAALVVALAALSTLRGGDSTAVDPITRRAVRFSVQPPAGTSIAAGFEVPFALAPDGRHLVFVATGTDGTAALWLHSFESERQQRLAGTEGATTPFWSPDGEWIAFFSERTLKKVRISTGLVQVIASGVATMAGATWGTGDVILFAGSPRGLRRVQASGGAMEATPNAEGPQLWPQFLSTGRHYLFAAGAARALRLGSLDHEPPRTLMEFPVRVSAIAYAAGSVFYVQDGQLFARRFDEARRSFSGEPVRIVDGVPVSGPGRAPFSVSASGMVAWWPYSPGIPATLRWVERDGRASTAVATAAKYAGFDVTADGRQLAISRIGSLGETDLWTRDLATGRETQLTFDGAAFVPRWAPDGTRLIFTGPGQRPPPKLFVQHLSRRGPASLVADSPLPEFVASVTADPETVISVLIDPTTGNDLWMRRLRDGRNERLSINTPANESYGRVSPDGHWLAWVSDVSGRPEVWVARFPTGDARRQISVDGGTMPMWTRGGMELVYVSGTKRVVSVPFSPESQRSPTEIARVLFALDDLVDLDPVVMPTLNAFAALPSGDRFLVAARAADPEAPPIHVAVIDWSHALTIRRD